MFGRKKTPAIDLSLKGIKEFIEHAKQFPVSSLSVGHPGARITVHQNLAIIAEPSAATESAAEAAQDYSIGAFEKIKSPTVGIFVPVKGITDGASIKKDQVVARIAAMKIETDILAPRDCVIKETLAKASDQIEYGQPLFFIE